VPISLLRRWGTVAQVCQRSRRAARPSLLVAGFGRPVGNKKREETFRRARPMARCVRRAGASDNGGNFARHTANAGPWGRLDLHRGHACRPSISGRRHWLSFAGAYGRRPAPTQGIPEHQNGQLPRDRWGRPPVIADRSGPVAAVVVRRWMGRDTVQQAGFRHASRSLSWLSIEEVPVAAPRLQHDTALPV
jgi:hypothetical protein